MYWLFYVIKLITMTLRMYCSSDMWYKWCIDELYYDIFHSLYLNYISWIDIVTMCNILLCIYYWWLMILMMMIHWYSIVDIILMILCYDGIIYYIDDMYMYSCKYSLYHCVWRDIIWCIVLITFFDIIVILWWWYMKCYWYYIHWWHFFCWYYYSINDIVHWWYVVIWWYYYWLWIFWCILMTIINTLIMYQWNILLIY